jgi:hypothetical protein
MWKWQQLRRWEHSSPLATLNPAAADVAVTEIKATDGLALSVEMDVTAEQTVNDGLQRSSRHSLASTF